MPLTRRQFHRTAALGALGLAAGCGGDGHPAGPPAEEPLPAPPRGIVLITADDLGWRDLSSYGLAAVSTPHIDRLVEHGVAFDRAFDVVSTCSSSRASLATGQFPHTHGVTGLTHRHPELSLPVGTPTLAGQLRAHGHATALQGKWHLSEEGPEGLGYDQWLDTPIDQRIRDVTPALEFLRDVAAVPFFLELNFMQTHRDLLDRFVQAEGFEVDPEVAAPPDYWGLPDWPELREEVAGYLSQLRWMDALIGQVLAELDALGLGDDTLVVFVSDNGPPFPGCKLTLYDRGIGTPLAFHWPAALPPMRSDALVSSTQVAPTVLELAGAPSLPQAQSTSLVPLLLGADHDAAEAVFAEMEQHIDPHPARAVRTDRYKYIRNLDDAPWGSGDGHGDYLEALAAEPDQTWDEPRPAEELFDLQLDPTERTNLAGDHAHAALLAELRQRLVDHAVATDDPRLDELTT